MKELLVIICAELILLVSIVVMTILKRRADVLARYSFDKTNYTASNAGGNKRPHNKHARRKRAPRPASPGGQRAKTIPRKPRQSGREIPPVPPEIRGLIKHFQESGGQYGQEPIGGIANRRDHPDQGQSTPASLPQGVRIYAVGDIHGRLDLISGLFPCIEADCRQRPVQRAITVFIGDYIDRGPHSRDVIDLLLRWRESHDAIFLRGNHETFVPRFLSDSKTLDDWRQCGGLETLLSYGLQPTINPDQDEQELLANQLANSLPKEHFDFLESLKPSFSCGDFYFVHAGIRPGISIDEQAEEDLLWIREEFLAHEQPFERFVIHGHTPVEAVDFRSNRINIDTGAFATGLLTCIVIEGCDVTQLPSAVQSATFSAL